MDLEETTVQIEEADRAPDDAGDDLSAGQQTAGEIIGGPEDDPAAEVIGGPASGAGPLGTNLEAALADEGDEPGAGAGAVTSFDFNRPNSISRHFEQQLRNLCENLAKTATISLTNLFRVNSQLEFTALRLLPCGDYLAELPNPTCVATVSLSPLKGQSLVQLDLGLCFSMLRKLMGGAAEAEGMVREFTEIERSIFRNLIVRLMEMFGDAAARLVEIKPGFGSIENNPDYLAGVATGDTLVNLRFQLKLDTLEGRFEIGIPMSSFEPVRELFDPEERRELRSRQEQREDRRQILDLVQGTASEVVTNLGSLETNLETIMRLREGDLLHLPQPVDAPLLVEVEGKPMFWGEAGRVHQNRAVKLTERIREE